MASSTDCIAHLRARANLNNKKIADIVGATNNTVSNWRTSKTRPHYRYMMRLQLICELVDILLDEHMMQPKDVFDWFMRGNSNYLGKAPSDAINELSPNQMIIKAKIS